MRWIKLVGSLTGLLAGLAVAGAGFAQPPFGGPHGGGGPGRFIEEHAARLALDDQTRETIEKIVDESRGRARELRQEVRSLRREMHDLLAQESPEEAAVIQQAEAIGRAETELHKHRLATLIKIRSLLSDEQRAELIRIREETRALWVRPLIEACEADVDQFCSDGEDRWSRRRCLREHWDELSDDCRSAIDSAKQDARRRLRGGFGRGEMAGF